MLSTSYILHIDVYTYVHVHTSDTHHVCVYCYFAKIVSPIHDEEDTEMIEEDLNLEDGDYLQDSDYEDDGDT